MFEAAVEIKGSAFVDKRNIYGLDVFAEAFSPKKSILVCNEKEKRMHGKIAIIPWEAFLHELWSGKIL